MSDYRDSHVAERAGKILVVSTVILSVVVVAVYFIHLYAKWFLYRREDSPNNHSRRPRRQDLAAEQQSGVTVLRRGLDPSFLKTLPLIPFDPKHFKQGLECAVCLSDVAQGEKARILPNCSHGFHVECIDMWFYSHSTCPICRNPVSPHTQVSVEILLQTPQTQQQSTTDSQHLPTNILFWGDETQVSTLTSQLQDATTYHETPVLTSSSSSSSSSPSSQTNAARPDLVIEIPTQNDSDCDCDQDKKSPVSSRMPSLRRILSSGSRYINPFSLATSNNEQGTRGAYF